MTQEQEAICALTGKLAAREKRMREVAEDLKQIRLSGTQNAGFIDRMRAKLLEGLGAEPFYPGNPDGLEHDTDAYLAIEKERKRDEMTG